MGVSDAYRGYRALLVALMVLPVACAPTVGFLMVGPQASADNRYVGPDMEVAFTFHDDWIGVEMANGGDSEVIVDWENASFVGPDGSATRLISAGGPLLRALPAGSRTTVKLKPAEWTKPAPTLWHRRAHLEKRLVHHTLLSQCVPVVRLVFPIRRFSAAGNEALEFAFRVSSSDGRKPAGGGHVDSPLF
jgi:hypothetical protein